MIPVVLVGGCTALDDMAGPTSGGETTGDAVAEVRPQARPETEADVAAPVATGALGTTVATLGDPSQPGLWIETPLVGSEQPGAVKFKGKTVAVRMIPSGGPATGGSRLSLAAMQALGAPLTDLVEVSLSAG